MSFSQSNRNKINTQGTRRQTPLLLKNSKPIHAATKLRQPISNSNTYNSYNSNYNTRTDYKMQYSNDKFTKPAFGLFNYLESPFYAKKMNDLNSRKYRQKALKQQQYWSYQNYRNKQPGSIFFNPSPAKPTDMDYKKTHSYLNRVVPPTPDAINEYNRSPLFTSK